MVVIGDRLAPEIEGPGGEIFVIARKTVLDGAAEDRQVARCRDLSRVRQTGGVAEGRAIHAERTGLARHHVSEGAFVAADILRDRDGDIVGGAGDDGLDGVLNIDRGARAEAELCRLLRCGTLRDRNVGVEPDTPLLEFLEQQIERHHFGDRGRVMRCAFVLRRQRTSCVRIDDDRRIGRPEEPAGGMSAGSALSARMVPVPGRPDVMDGVVASSMIATLMAMPGLGGGAGCSDHRRGNRHGRQQGLETIHAAEHETHRH